MLYMKSANINVRIDEELYRKTKELGINISETVREALVSKIERKKREIIMEEMDKASRAVKKIGIASITREIRKERENR